MFAISLTGRAVAHSRYGNKLVQPNDAGWFDGARRLTGWSAAWWAQLTTWAH